MTGFYRYYQVKEKSSWNTVEDDPKALQNIANSGAKRVSVLSLNTVITDDTDTSKVLYKGPFYVDIDNASDLQASIDAGVQFLDKLVTWQVPPSSFEIYLSGKKGIHFYLHPGLYGLTRALRHLPYIYGKMAVELFVPGMDFQVYSGGRGNLVRIPNVQREDGKFKVRVAPEELRQLTVSQYQALTSAPRTQVLFPPMQAPQMVNSFLTQAFARAKDQWAEELRAKPQQMIPDAALQPLQTTPPQCVTELAAYNVKPGVNFNRASMQMGIFLARSATPSVQADSIISRMATNGQSSTYSNYRDRKAHLEGLLSYYVKHPKSQFSCFAMRGLLNTKPCAGCILENQAQVAAEQYEVVERPDGYYAINDKGERRLTSFTLSPICVLSSKNPDTQQRVRAYTLATVESNHQVLGQVKIEEGAWASRSALVGAMAGIHNLKVTGGDSDVQNIKHYVLRDLENLDEAEIVDAAGLHRDKYGTKVRYTWVEEGLSVNKFYVRGTHTLETSVNYRKSALPRFEKVPQITAHHAEEEQALRDLFQINAPEALAPILGWFCATNLKAHLNGLYSQFPLLAIWGGRGSGKSRTASLVSALSGCDYNAWPPPVMTSITPFSVISNLISTTTIPRVFDEFNRSGMREGTYNHYAEMFKAAFNGAPIPRGRLRSKSDGAGKLGAVVDNFYATAPVCMLSEHVPDVPALNDRTYKVMLRPNDLAAGTAHYDRAVEHHEALWRVAKLLAFVAMKTRDEWVKDQMKTWEPLIPRQYTERERYGRQVIGVGLDYLERTLKEEVNMDLSKEVDDLRAAFMTQVNDTNSIQAASGYKTETDRLIEKLGEIKTLQQSGNSPVMLAQSHIKVVGNTLYVEPYASFSLLLIFLNHLRERIPFRDPRQFEQLLRTEPYFIGTTIQKDMSVVRPVFQLDLQAMQNKGLNTTLFL